MPRREEDEEELAAPPDATTASGSSASASAAGDAEEKERAAAAAAAAAAAERPEEEDADEEEEDDDAGGEVPRAVRAMTASESRSLSSLAEAAGREQPYRVGPEFLARMIDSQTEGLALLRLHHGVKGLARDLLSSLSHGIFTAALPYAAHAARPDAAAGAGGPLADADAAADGARTPPGPPRPRPRAGTMPPLMRAATARPERGRKGGRGSLFRATRSPAASGDLGAGDGWGVSDPDLLKAERQRHADGHAARNGVDPSLLSRTERKYLRSTARLPLDVRMRSRERFGWNRLPPADFKSLWSIVLEALGDPTLIMLVVAAAISLGVGIYTEGAEHGWTDGAAVLVAVGVVVVITTLNDYQKERQFRELNDKKNDHEVSVVRNGRTEVIGVQKLVVGDLVLLHRGDVVPADGVYVRGSDLQIDESTATGESEAVPKGLPAGCWDGDVNSKDPAAAVAPRGVSPFFLSGTTVLEGSGVMLVVAVGEHSFHGRTMMSLRAPAQVTPLQRKLTRMANFIGVFGVLAAVGIFVAQMIKYFVVNRDDLDVDDAVSNSVEFLVIAIAIVVVAVPEGLPLAVTISLAYSMKRMMRDKNLVRRLDACETMGGATYICSDKTGTLTTNQMTVQRGWYAGRPFDGGAGDPLLPTAEERLANAALAAPPTEAALEIAHDAVVMSTTASKDMVEETKRLQWTGSQTECGLLRFVEATGTDPIAWRRKRGEVLRRFTFNSTRKRASCVARALGGEPGDTFMTAGASEVVLAMCTRRLRPDGGVEPLDAATRKRLLTMIDDMAGAALRTMCVAFRPVEAGDLRDWTDEEEPGLVVAAVLGMSDPLRDEVPEAVRRCQAAGVHVCMVTGDNRKTALNIAAGCGIFDEARGDRSMLGEEFRALTPEEQQGVAPGLAVLARSSPADKLALVTALQKVGEVVAVTGDGVNDAPALKRADVGFSMGLSGTQVAKEASAIVLLDDNFVSLVNAIKWGRNVFDSVRKFLQFQLTVNFAAILLVTVVVLADADGDASNTPLQTVQLLWINLIMDSFAAVALATEPPTNELLTFKPYGHDEPLVTPYMMRKMALQVVMQTGTFLAVTYRGHDFFSSGHADPTCAPDAGGAYTRTHYTIVFNVFVLSQLFNEFNARKVRPEINVFGGLSRHPLFCGIWLFSFLVQGLIVEFGGSALHVCPLSLSQWARCIAVGVLPLLWNLLYGVGLALCGDHSRPVSRLEQAVYNDDAAGRRFSGGAAQHDGAIALDVVVDGGDDDRKEH